MNKPFPQIIKNFQGSTALVESKKGNIYPVIVSDRVRQTKGTEIEVGDIAMVRKWANKYFMVDVKKSPKNLPESHLSEVDLNDLGYDY